MERLRDKWFWNAELLRPVVIVPTLAILIAVAAGYRAMGPSALLWLSAGIAPIIIGLIYGVVGSKVRALKASLSAEEGEIEESLIVVGYVQSPGVAILTDQTLRLIPIVGKEVSVNLQEIESVRETAFFNGKSMICKRWLVLSAKPRLGFALPTSTANRWCQAINALRQPEINRR